MDNPEPSVQLRGQLFANRNNRLLAKQNEQSLKRNKNRSSLSREKQPGSFKRKRAIDALEFPPKLGLTGVSPICLGGQKNKNPYQILPQPRGTANRPPTKSTLTQRPSHSSFGCEADGPMGGLPYPRGGTAAPKGEIPVIAAFLDIAAGIPHTQPF